MSIIIGQDMFHARRLQILSAYSNASEILNLQHSVAQPVEKSESSVIEEVAKEEVIEKSDSHALDAFLAVINEPLLK